MASTINASTTLGLISTADTSGVLQLQTANTTAVTVDASQNVGVGMTPVYKLDVTGGNGNAIRFTDSVNSVQVAMGAFNSNGFFGTLSNHSQLFYVNSGEKMRLDTAGNLGLGTTTTATWKLNVAQNTQYVATMYQSGGVSHGNKAAILAFYDGTYYNSVAYWAHTHAWTINGGGTQAMTLDASGNLGIGTSSPTQKLDVYGNGMKVNNASYVGYLGAGNTFAGGAASDFCVRSDNVLSFATAGPYERARIDSSGNLLVGKTSANVGVVGCELRADGAAYATRSGSTNATETLGVYSTGASAYRFYVGMAGTVYATSTTITAISDQRLKENIRDLDDGLDVVMALKPRKFDWKQGKGQDIKNARGFIAQEFETVLPDMVETWRDPAPEGEEAYKAINANLIPTLVKAIQEQQAIIESLKARLDAANL